MNTFQVIETPFDMARDLADLAQKLDESKFKFSLEVPVRAQALSCANTMYDMAEVLAGDRAEEVVGKSDGSEEPRRNAQESAGPGWAAL